MAHLPRPLEYVLTDGYGETHRWAQCLPCAEEAPTACANRHPTPLIPHGRLVVAAKYPDPEMLNPDPEAEYVCECCEMVFAAGYDQPFNDDFDGDAKSFPHWRAAEEWLNSLTSASAATPSAG